MKPSSDLSNLVDQAEAMRRQGRVHEALEAVEGVLEETPGRPRALLLRGRLLYELGSMTHATEALRDLGRIIGDGQLQPLFAAIKQLGDSVKSWSAPAFATESMARLLARQGYLLEALEVYRRLFEAAPEKSELWDEIIRIRAAVGREGSRGVAKEKVKREIEAWDGWLRKHRRGS